MPSSKKSDVIANEPTDLLYYRNKTNCSLVARERKIQIAGFYPSTLPATETKKCSCCVFQHGHLRCINTKLAERESKMDRTEQNRNKEGMVFSVSYMPFYFLL